MNHFKAIATIACFAAFPATAIAGCGHYSSSVSTQPADVRFENNTNNKVNVIWYKFNGGT
jgi:hypothetical protein